MAAFSRGLGLGLALSHRIISFAPMTASKSCYARPAARVAHAIRRSPLIQAARNLQISARLQAAKQSPPPMPKVFPLGKPKPVAATELAPAPTRGTPSAAPSVAKLVSQGRQTVLYQSASHFWMRFSSISAAVFCISFAGINYYSAIIRPPPGLAWYVPVAFAFACFVMAVFGNLFLLSTARAVRRITAKPTSALPRAYLQPGRAKLSADEQRALRALRASPVALECDVAGTLPLLGARKIVAAPSEVFAPFKWAQLPIAGAGPARAAPGGVFFSVRRGLLAEGFAPIMIKGKRYKVDVLAGTVYDHGRALDRLMPPRPDKFTNTWLDRLLKR